MPSSVDPTEFLILSLCRVKQVARSRSVYCPGAQNPFIMDDFHIVGLGKLEVGPAHRCREIGDWWWDCPRHCFRVILLVKSGLRYTAILCASPYFRKLTPKVQEMERNGPMELHQTKPGFPSCDVFIKLLRCIGWGSSGSYGRLARWNHPCSWRTSWTSCRN